MIFRTFAFLHLTGGIAIRISPAEGFLVFLFLSVFMACNEGSFKKISDGGSRIKKQNKTCFCNK